ncbi:YncE family protein [Sorangium sp. So ce406]|uniref:YncE family protein n=1 Tax=Sorangium sp. So ce406 TaxID=3133311 RepID=UPI003F5CA7D4
MTERRVPCPSCGVRIVEGARKCRACKAWLGERPRGSSASLSGREPRLARAAVSVASGVAAVIIATLTSLKSPVGEAPPLTALTPEGAASSPEVRDDAPNPAAFGPDPTPPPPPPEPTGRWRAREFRIGDVHPLDVVFNPSGTSIYVSADDASLREYKLDSGELIHKASVPAQGDHIRLLFDRYVAVLRHEDAARIPVMDTTAWDRDPVLLDVGRSPGDIVALPDGRTVVAATTDTKRVTKFELPTGVRLANITLPHATGQLFLVQAEGRPYIAALGALTHAGRPAGAWIDLFDPSESPFGATRRSIAVGREPREGDITADGGAVFFPDRLSNTAILLSVAGVTETRKAPVGVGPTAGFLLHDDRYGITLNADGRNASVIDLSAMAVKSTLPFRGVPRTGVTSPDRRTLFVALGGTQWPPVGSGVAVIAGDPPKVVASLPTGKGACAVAVSKDGARAVVASYWDRSITVLEQQ